MHNFSTDQGNRHRRYIIIGTLTAVIYLGAVNLFGPVLGLSLGVVSSILYISFTRYLWKWERLHDYGLVGVPNLNGTWEGHLYSSADEDSIPDDQIVTTGRQIDGLTKQETSIEIKQTWDKILVSLEGPESPSYSRAATILVEKRAWPTLSYNYLNEGSQTNEELEPHYGSAILEYDEEEEKLEGKYYNRPDQRGTHGILELYWND